MEMEIANEIKSDICDNYTEETESKPSTSIYLEDVNGIKQEPWDDVKNEIKEEIIDPSYLEAEIVKEEVSVKEELVSRSPENLDWISSAVKHDDVNNWASDDFKSLLKCENATVFECHLCDYRCATTSKLNEHSLEHKSPNEAPLYMCDDCDYQTKYKRNLTTHIKKSHSAIDQKRFMCDLCGHRSKTKSNLQSHFLVHKSIDDVHLYKCNGCDYSSKHKSGLGEHIKRRHSDIEKRYKCDSCDYRCFRKFYLKIHNLVHKSANEVPLFKCSECTYQSKHRRNLEEHIQRMHLPVSERRFKCDVCDYRGVTNSDVTRHSAMHKNPEDLKLYRCDSCDFQTKGKSHLVMHLKRHSAFVDRKFKCDLCCYRGLTKADVNKHGIVHKNEEELPLYKCERCGYQSKYKHHVVKHQARVHGETSSGAMKQSEMQGRREN